MAVDKLEEIVKKYAIEITDEVKVGSIESGEGNEIQMLVNLRDKLGETKLLNNPSFFYWNFKINPVTIELCGYDIDEIDSSVSLFAVDFGEPYHQVYKEVVDRLGARATNFVRFALQPNEKALSSVVENEALDLYSDLKRLSKTDVGISRINVIIVSNGISNLRSRENKGTIKGFEEIDIEYILWDVKWLYENCMLEKEHESISLDFSDEKLNTFVEEGGLSFLRVPQSEAYLDCYQCVVPGKLLAFVYRKYGSPLLEGNVRSFLSSKTAVNKNIQMTIQKEPKRFYVYNNGIAAIASGVEFTESEDGSRISKIEDIQIINGGQTTASLAYAERKRYAKLDDIFVPMKLTIIKPEELEASKKNTLIQTISRTSNSQNKVSDADFFANHPFHTLMKRFSLDLSVPGIGYNTYWFYERARGEYSQETMFMSENEKNTFLKRHPKSMYLTKTDFAKFVSLREKRPDSASKGGGTNFNEFAKIVNEVYENNKQAKYNELFFKEITGVAKIYRALEPNISIKNPKTNDWFGGSYRANVLNYAISAFFYALERQYPDKAFDFRIIWDKGISEQLLDELIDICKIAYFVLTDPSRPVENVTQWAKRRACWDSMKDRIEKTQLDDSLIQKYLMDVQDYIRIQREAKQFEKISFEVQAYNIAFDSNHQKAWVPLYQFVCDNTHMFSDLTTEDKSILALMKNMMFGKGKNSPNKVMCDRALKILEEAEIHGFKY